MDYAFINEDNLDENGEGIILPSGEYKSHKENTVDWNDRRYSEIWRSAWAEAVNRCFERNGIETRFDLRSYERQGKDRLPTIHLGPAVSHIEKKGQRTGLGEYNREIEGHVDMVRGDRREGQRKPSKSLEGLNVYQNWVFSVFSICLMLDFFKYLMTPVAG